MKNNLYIQKSQVSTLSKNPNGLFDLKKWTTNLLTDYGLIAGDPCCVSGATGVSGNISEARYSVFTGIAASGTTETTATVLDYGVNVIEIADINNTAIKLPQPVTGKSVKISNMTSLTIYVFPSNVGGKINNLPINTALAIPPDGAIYEFICTENPYPGNWNILGVPGSSSFAFTISINHVHGVADDICTAGNGTVTSALSVYATMGGNGTFTLHPSSANFFSLPQFATSTYLKVYSNITTADLGPTWNDGINIVRNTFFVYHDTTPPAHYVGNNTWGDEILFLQDNTGSMFNVTEVTTGPTPASSSAAAIGDNTTLYSELPAMVYPYIGTMTNIPNYVSNNYSNYRISIPASAATKTYNFYIVQEYM